MSSSGKKSVLILDCGSESLSSGSDDLGRIVRPLDAEGRDEWTRFNIDSIESFAKVQEESEIAFFEKKGSLSVGSDVFVSKPASLLRAKKIEHEIVRGGEEICSEVRVPESKDDSGGVRRGFRSSGRIRFAA